MADQKKKKKQSLAEQVKELKSMGTSSQSFKDTAEEARLQSLASSKNKKLSEPAKREMTAKTEAKQTEARRQYTTEGAYTPKTKVDGSKAAETKTTNQTARAFAKETGQLAGTKPAAKPKPKAESTKPKPKASSSGSSSAPAPASASKPKPKPKPSYALSKEEAARFTASLPKTTKTKKTKPKKRSGYTRQWER